MFGKGSPFYSILRNKCPRCHQGDLYLSKNPYNLPELGKMPDECPKCQQPYQLEPGFFFGATYVSYGLTVAFMVSLLMFNYWFLHFRLVQAVLVVVGLFVLISPIIFRLSRSIYLNFFVSYDPEIAKKVSQ